MSEKQPPKGIRSVWQIVKSAVLLNMAVFALTALGGLIRGWLTWEAYSRALQWIGLGEIALAGIGLLSNMSSTQRARFERFKQLERGTPGPESSEQLEKTSESSQFVYMMVLAGIIAMLLGAAIQKFLL